MLYVWPLQIVPLEAVIVGLLITVTVDVAVLALTQPAELVPTTVYEVLTVGETFALPPCIVYEFAPVGLIEN